MLRKKTLKQLRIFLFILLFISFIVPVFFIATETIEFNYKKDIMEIQTESEFSVSFSKDIRSGTILVSILNDQNEAIKSVIYDFKNAKAGEELVFEAKASRAEETRYQISEIYVNSEDLMTVELISQICSGLIFLALLLFIFRAKALEIEAEGHKIEVYSGLISHKIIVDDKVIMKQNKAFFVDTLKMVCLVEDVIQVEASITCNKRISVFVSRKEIEKKDEEENKTESATKKSPTTRTRMPQSKSTTTRKPRQKKENIEEKKGKLDGRKKKENN